MRARLLRSPLRRLELRPRRRRLLALVAFRDEMRFLPGFFESVAPQVDGIIALDDQSADDSAAYVGGRPEVLELLRIPRGSLGELEDGVLHRRLTEAAWEHRADWLLGLDADERPEVGFRARAEGAIDSAEASGHDALWVAFKEMWKPGHFRVDGVWGTKHKACLFKSDPAHVFDDKRVHAHWASLPEPDPSWPVADARIYHLRMLAEADRRARHARYVRIDPHNEIQPIGYDYMLEQKDLELQVIEPGRGYVG